MKLLILTQSIDRNNPVLGFFHGWVEEFSKYFNYITVICLESGECDLPKNVKVLSLGKESGKSKIKYILNFYKYIWNERKNYDSVFVHMNQEYVLLGSIIWKILNKKITMWRNHHNGNIFTDLACRMCHRVFSTSRYSYTTKFKNTLLMPVGIDLETFKVNNQISRVKNSILFLGRIAPVKRPDILIDALRSLKEKNIQFTASFYGDPLPKDLDYYNSLIEKVSHYGLNNFVSFCRSISNSNTVDVYNKHEIFVNLSSSGMYDKTIFEAMACGCIVLASNHNLKDRIKDMFVIEKIDTEYIVQKLVKILDIEDSERLECLEINKNVVFDESLDKLAHKLINEMLKLK